MMKAGVFCGLFVLMMGLCGGAGLSAAGDEEMDNAVNYRSGMVDLIEELHLYARGKNPSFALMGNNGLALFLPEGEYTRQDVRRMMNSVDGIFMEEYNYGWEMKDGIRTPLSVKAEIMRCLNLPKESKMPMLNVDYCEKEAAMINAYEESKRNGFIGFSADSRQLDTIPKTPKKIYNESDRTIVSLTDVRNFLILLNPERFRSKAEYIMRLRQTNYDLLIIDLTFNGQMMEKEDIDTLKVKHNGGKRLVFSYMSVGEAEDYRPYWRQDWAMKKPEWIAAENADWTGNYKVKYWREEWKSILYGGEAAYLDMILARGFDGAFLDVIDAFYYFEELND